MASRSRNPKSGRIKPVAPEPTSLPEAPPSPKPPPSLARAGLTAIERLSEIIEQLEREIAECDDGVPKNQVAALYGQLLSAVRARSKLDGEEEISHARILKSKVWAELRAVVLEVVGRFPGGTVAFVEALDAFAKSGGVK